MEPKNCQPDCIHSYTLTGLEKESYKCISNPELLLSELRNIRESDERYIFRGQSNKDFLLHPKLFRMDELEKLRQEFPSFSCYQKWCASESVKQLISLCSSNEWSVDNLEVKKLFALTIYIMQYNYKLANYVEKNSGRFDAETLKFYKRKDASYWANEETFKGFFYRNLDQLMGIQLLDGRIVKYSEFNEILTIADESLPQHYGVSTSALDWTHDPYISIYFALDNILKNATHVSIYVYKEINPSENNPILIKSGHPNIENPRIKAQKGVFTCIQYPCSFYFFHERWPSIEDYIPISQDNFELTKYDIPICHADYFKKILDRNNITKKSLFPDLENSPCISLEKIT